VLLVLQDVHLQKKIDPALMELWFSTYIGKLTFIPKDNWKHIYVLARVILLVLVVNNSIKRHLLILLYAVSFMLLSSRFVETKTALEASSSCH